MDMGKAKNSTASHSWKMQTILVDYRILQNPSHQCGIGELVKEQLGEPLPTCQPQSYHAHAYSHRIFFSELSGFHQAIFFSGWSPRSCLAISALWFATLQIPVVISVTFPTATVQSWDSDAECLIQQSSPANHLLLETSTTVGSGRLYAKLGGLLQTVRKNFVKDFNISSTV